MEGNRLNELIKAVVKASRGDYSVQIGLKNQDDQLDTIANGFNIIIDDIKEKQESLKRCQEDLKEAKESFFWQSQELEARNEEFGAYADLLLKQKNELEEKTAEVLNANKRHLAEIAKRTQAENMLRQSHEELEMALAKLQEAHAQMILSEKMASIGQLAAGVAHEINNPTGFVSSNLKTLGDYQQEIGEITEEYRRLMADLKAFMAKKAALAALSERVERIEAMEADSDLDFILDDTRNLIKESQEGTERIRKIVADLKDFAHPGQDNLQSVDINQCLESTLSVVWNELKYKTTVTKELGELPLVQGYPQQLNQVFLNLLVNSAQAIEDRGEITVATGAENGHVEIKIRDNGAGIPPEHMERIFDPFFTTKEVGKGTVFTIRLPASGQQEAG